MYNDVVKEQLVARRFGKREILLTLALGLLTMILVQLAFFLALAVISYQYALSFLLIAIILICMGVYWGLKVIPQEFEYLAVNGDLTVDRIIAKRWRRRVYSVDLRNIEAAGLYTTETRSKITHTIFKNCSVVEPSQGMYLVFNSMGGSKVLLVISPNEKMQAALKPYIASRLVMDGFPGGEWNEDTLPKFAEPKLIDDKPSLAEKVRELFESIKGKINKK